MAINPSMLDSPPVRVRVAGRTDVGQRRRENQDSFLVVDLSTVEDGGLVLEPGVERSEAIGGEFVLGPKGALCLVADGMGGAAAGGLASSVAVVAIHDKLVRGWVGDDVSTPDRFAMRLKEAVETGNQRIHEAARTDPRYEGMGTTATAVGLLGNHLYVAQVGDSRAYIVRSGEAVQMTHDQSYVQQLVDAGVVSEEEAERSQHRNVILQALGNSPFVDVDLTYEEVRQHDLLVVCSDGLTKVVDRKDIAETVERVNHPARVCDALVDLANSRGGPDNITVVAAFFAGDGLASPAGADDVGHKSYTLGTD